MDVINQLAQAGLEVGCLEYGRLVRCRADGDKGNKKSGWYVIHELRLDSGAVVTVGRFGNWKRYGNEALAIRFEGGTFSPAERQRLAEEQARLREEAEVERRARAAEAAERAARIWPKLPEAGKSPYLDRKKVRAFGVRFSRGSIVVPVRNTNLDLVGLQFIDADGSKRFLTGTPKQGCFHLIGELPASEGGLLWIAEGYATAATVHMATGRAVAVAFDAGNLKDVARAMRELLPGARIAIAADNDVATPGNPGVTMAREAALAVGGVFVAPQFEGVAA